MKRIYYIIALLLVVFGMCIYNCPESAEAVQSGEPMVVVSDYGSCVGDCSSEQCICIGQCNGNGNCISNCASAHGRCVASCNR